MINFPILMGFTSGAAFLAAWLIVTKALKANMLGNIFLGCFMFTLCLTILEVPLHAQNFHLIYPAVFEIIGLLRFLTAPFLYFSIVCFTTVNKKIQSIDLLHLLPFVLFLIFRIPFFITGKNLYFSYQTGRVVFFVLQTALPVQTAVYWLLSFTRLQLYLKKLKQIKSSVDQEDLHWLKSFLLIVLIIVTAWLNIVFLNIQGLSRFTPAIYLAGILFLSYYSLRQEEIFKFTAIELQQLEAITGNEKKNVAKRISDGRFAELEDALRSLMDINKVYLENDLSIPRLAGMLHASCNETSYVINKLNRDNFYNYINKYRIEEAKRLLMSEESSNLNILGIAFESGFNSKTTFNTTFKKMTGYSPTAYVKTFRNGEGKGN
jgi:AraC-like DNA-binding protein